MRRVEPEHQPIEQPPPAARAFDKQPVHLRRQPQHAEPLAERRLAARRLAVDAHHPALARRRRRGRCRSATGPRRVATVAATAQPGLRRRSTVARRSISLSRALRRPRPGDRNDIASSRLVLPAPFGPVSTTGAGDRAIEPGRAVIAEIGQDEPGHADAPGRRAQNPRRWRSDGLPAPRQACSLYGAKRLNFQRIPTLRTAASDHTRIGIST